MASSTKRLIGSAPPLGKFGGFAKPEGYSSFTGPAVRNIGFRPFQKAGVATRKWAQERTDAEEVVRDLSARVYSDAEEELEEVRAEAAEELKQARIAEDDTTLTDAVLVMKLVEAAALFRRILRTKCELHGWERLTSPVEVGVGDQYAFCSTCSLLCGSTPGERALYADAMGALGRWSVEVVASKKTEDVGCCQLVELDK
jgi:hypothetical protein